MTVLCLRAGRSRRGTRSMRVHLLKTMTVSRIASVRAQRPIIVRDGSHSASSGALGKCLVLPQRLHIPRLVAPLGVSIIQWCRQFFTECVRRSFIAIPSPMFALRLPSERVAASAPSSPLVPPLDSLLRARARLLACASPAIRADDHLAWPLMTPSRRSSGFPFAASLLCRAFSLRS